MTDIIIKQMPAFKKAYKKRYKQEREHVNNAIHKIVKNPEIGEEKKVIDLMSVFVNSKFIAKKCY